MVDGTVPDTDLLLRLPGVFFNQRPETTDNMSRDTLSTRMFGG